MGIAVGIDLGTTNSCVAVVQGDQAKVIADRSGRKIQPSVISFHPDGTTLAGIEAKSRQVIDPQNTVYSFKRLLGRDLASDDMQRLLKLLPFEVVEGPEGIPAISCRGREATIPEVSAMMLRHIKDMCQARLGVDIDEAVITVPANFNDLQRSSTKIAGRIAGYKVLRILNEPTAAALAYGFGAGLSERIAIYDFGGGTFDITIVELMDDIFEVLSTAGDAFLGGDDFDLKIADEMRGQFLREHKLDLGDDPSAMQRIRSVAERIKCQLSSLDEVQAALREIAYGAGGKAIDFPFEMQRGRFEKLIEPLVDRSLQVCDEALKLAKLDRASLDNLVLVGGTTRVPLVRQKVAEFFDREPRTEINPDEVVAIGAAIHAYSLTGAELSAALPAVDVALDPVGEVSPSGVFETVGGSPAVRMSAFPGVAPVAPPPAIALEPEPASAPETKQAQRTLIGMPQIAVAPIAAPGAPPAEFAELDLDADPEPIAPAGASADLEIDELQELLDKAVAASGRGSVGTGVRAIEPVRIDGPEDSDALPIALDDDEQELTLDSLEPVLPEPSPLAPPPPPPAAFDKTVLAPPAAAPPPPVAAPPQLDIVEGEDLAPPDEESISFSVPLTKAAPTLLLDVTPRSLGIATAGGYCDEVIERNAAIPVEQSRLFATSSDNQTEVSIEVFQGESRRVEENTKLGRVLLTGIRPAPRGEIKIRVTFEIDTDGMLGVAARNEETGEAQATRIQLSGGLDEDQVNALVQKYAK